MQFNGIETELTTAATDAAMGLLCTAVLVCLWRIRARDRWKTGVWICVIGLLGLASLLGAVAHGFEISDSLRSALWQPLYLSLGVTVALFVVGALYDWRGKAFARRSVPVALVVAVGFYGATLVSSAGFLLFVVYEGVAMLAALALYVFLAVKGRLTGAATMALAIALNIVAAGVQASDLSLQLIWTFDHNGVFHFIQMADVMMLTRGLIASREPESEALGE